MSDTRDTAAVAYVTDANNFFPPLPPAFGHWLVDLADRAYRREDPDSTLPVPDAVRDSGYALQPATRDADGRLTITLRDALRCLKQEELLEADDPELPNGLELFTPANALSLANTADSATFTAQHDPQAIAELAARLRESEWIVQLNEPIRVDSQGRLTSGLNVLLAIVTADTPAPAVIIYDYDTVPRPFTWRPPHTAPESTA